MDTARELHDLLARQGYRPTLEAGETRSRVVFRAQGDLMSFDCPANDPTYIALRAIYTAERHERRHVLAVANDLNAEYKSVKVTTYEDPRTVTFSLEAWYSSVEDFAPQIDRWIGLMLEISNDTFGRLRRVAAEEGVTQ